MVVELVASSRYRGTDRVEAFGVWTLSICLLISWLTSS